MHGFCPFRGEEMRVISQIDEDTREGCGFYPHGKKEIRGEGGINPSHVMEKFPMISLAIEVRRERYWRAGYCAFHWNFSLGREIWRLSGLIFHLIGIFFPRKRPGINIGQIRGVQPAVRIQGRPFERTSHVSKAGKPSEKRCRIPEEVRTR